MTTAPNNGHEDITAPPDSRNTSQTSNGVDAPSTAPPAGSDPAKGSSNHRAGHDAPLESTTDRGLVKSLSVVIVAFNEEGALPRTIDDAISYLDAAIADPELVIVDDGSQDGTWQVAQQATERRPWIQVARHPSNRGMGAALKTGYAMATKPYVTFLPGDGQIRSDSLSALVALAPEADLVVSMYSKRDDGLLRAILSRGLRVTTRIVAGTWVTSQGPYLFRRSAIENLRLQSNTFFLNLELPIRAERAGRRIAVATMEAVPRQAGDSKVVSIRKIARVFSDLVRLRWDDLTHR